MSGEELGDGVAVERFGQAAGRNLHNGGRQQHITRSSRLPCALHSWHLVLCCSSMLGSPLMPLVSSLPCHLGDTENTHPCLCLWGKRVVFSTHQVKDLAISDTG